MTMFPSGGFNSGISGAQATSTGDPRLTEKDLVEQANKNGEPVGDYLQGASHGYYNAAEVLDAVNKGLLDPYTAQYYLSSGARGYMSMTEEQEKYFNNLLARYQSQNALTWQAQQLQALGLSNAGVLQTGAAHTAQDWSNVATNKADRAHKTALSMIDMAGRMASAGIHGTALYAVKSAAAQAATLTAHTARSSVTHYNSKGQITGSSSFYKYDDYKH